MTGLWQALIVLGVVGFIAFVGYLFAVAGGQGSDMYDD